ncbi:hypothetical protein SAMN03159363_1308 [Variovorax sp. EL159]|nr:hypothetical protein SAMN03159363_1308 [Variovorax sp. EL159]
MALENKFVDDLAKVAADLIGTYGLLWQPSTSSAEAAMQRWLDFRFRYVEPRPRTVIYSDKFPKSLPASVEAELLAFETSAKAGDDLNPRQGRGLTEHHDASGTKASRRTDALWADWGLLHFHLCSLPSLKGGYHTQRSGDMAICVANDEHLAIIDVVPHPKDEGWANPDFIETLHRSWPDAMDPFRIRGLTQYPALTQDQIHALRSNSTNYSVTLGGESFINPGWGFMGTKTSMKAYMAMMHAMKAARELAQFASNPEGPIANCLAAEKITEPALCLVVVEGKLCIHDGTSKILFPLMDEDSNQGNALGTIKNTVLPDWAAKRL